MLVYFFFIINIVQNVTKKTKKMYTFFLLLVFFFYTRQAEADHYDYRLYVSLVSLFKSLNTHLTLALSNRSHPFLRYHFPRPECVEVRPPSPLHDFFALSLPPKPRPSPARGLSLWKPLQTGFKIDLYIFILCSYQKRWGGKGVGDRGSRR